jgi:hypothetical protein
LEPLDGNTYRRFVRPGHGGVLRTLASAVGPPSRDSLGTSQLLPHYCSEPFVTMRFDLDKRKGAFGYFRLSQAYGAL